MMKQLIACCGLDCESCDARRATLADDDEMREQIARQWSEMNAAPEITAETINCTGCRTEGIKYAFCDRYCPVRKCAMDKGYATCGDCPELNDCPTVGTVFQHNPTAKANLL